MDEIYRKALIYFLEESRITARRFAESIGSNETYVSQCKSGVRNLSLEKFVTGVHAAGYSFTIDLKNGQIVFKSKNGDIKYS